MRSGKLFTLVRDTTVPILASYDAKANEYVPIEETFDAAFAINWPNGAPCPTVEMYLLAKSMLLRLRRDDGGSAKVLASDLSHLVRFCWEKQKDFWELYDDDYYEFALRLQSERGGQNSGVARRNNNTVRRIIDNGIAFLTWLQENIVIGVTLVGKKEVGPNICLVEKKVSTPYNGVVKKLVFPHQPPPCEADGKRPISRDIRNKLWDAARELSEKDTRNLPRRQRDFLRARRELMLLLLEATGSRPGELVQLGIAQNADCTTTGKVVLVTLKRRLNVDPVRRIPIDRGSAIKLELFVDKHRKAMLANIAKMGVAPASVDAVFVSSKSGAPLTRAALSKEFQRLREFAGIEGRACMSMYRHRFITNMVRLHLLEFLSENKGITRAMVTDADYRTILKRVAVFTGHGSVDSLLRYIDWAWEEMGVFDHVEPAHAFEQMLTVALRELQSAQNLLSRNATQLKDHVSSAASILEKMRETAALAGEQASQAAHDSRP
jgi:integrase